MKTKTLISLIALASCVGLASCGGNNSNEPTTSVIEEARLVLSQTKLTIEKYEEAVISYELTGSSEKVTWRVSDPNVATVLNGTVSAVGIGNCVITAKAGNLTATCDVEVTMPSQAAVLVVGNSDINLLVGGEEYKTNLFATYKGDRVPATFDLSFVEGEPSDVVSLRHENNKLVVTPLKAGATKAIVSATVRDTLLVKVINITVDNA